MNNQPTPNYTQTTFGQITKKLVNGGTPSTEIAHFWNGKIPWITGADFTTNGIGEFRRFVSETAIVQTATNLIDQGQLLLVTRTGVGKLAIAPCDIAISQDITGVYPDTEKVDVRFLYHRMRLGVEDLKKLNQGTSINGIIRRDLFAYPIQLPALPQQRRIAEILSTLDEAIEQTEALIAKHQQIKAGLMHDLFTRGVTPDGHLRPTREQAPDLYKESPLGWIPKEWEVARIDNPEIAIIDGDRGVHYPQAHELLESGHCLFLSATNVTRDGFKFDTTQFISREKDELLGTGKLARGDIVITTRGTVGNIAHFDNSVAFSDVRINSGMVIIRSTHRGLDTEFLYCSLRNYVFLREYQRVVSGSAQPQLPIRDMKRFHCLMPPLPEQQLIVGRVALIDNRLGREEEFLAKLRQQKHGLMHDLLTGRVRITVNEAEAASGAIAQEITL